jgi:phage recombination protein Bet
METNETQLTKPSGSAVEYVPFGAEDKIKLTASMVRTMIAVPTKSGKLPTETDCIKFIALARSRRLNPFEGDCFMIGYDGADGPKFSLITAHQAFIKRGEASGAFDGMESGIIVKRGEETLELHGDYRDDGDKLLGGWAKVYRSDRKFPAYRRLKLATYHGNNRQWNKDPEGMIVKCAEADAVRSSFPTLCGGMRMMDDGGPTIDVPTVTTERVMIGQSTTVNNPTPEPTGSPEFRPTAAPPEPSDGGAAVSTQSPQDELAEFVFNECDSTVDKFNKAMLKNGHLTAEVPDMDSVPLALAKRLLRAKSGLRSMLEEGGAE